MKASPQPTAVISSTAVTKAVWLEWCGWSRARVTLFQPVAEAIEVGSTRRCRLRLAALADNRKVQPRHRRHIQPAYLATGCWRFAAAEFGRRSTAFAPASALPRTPFAFACTEPDTICHSAHDTNSNYMYQILSPRRPDDCLPPLPRLPGAETQHTKSRPERFHIWQHNETAS